MSRNQATGSDVTTTSHRRGPPQPDPQARTGAATDEEILGHQLEHVHGEASPRDIA